MYKKYLVLLAVLLFAVPAFADIARPDRTPKRPKKETAIDSRLTIRLDKDAKEARLIIPRSELKGLIAQLGTDEMPAVKVGGISQAQTIMGARSSRSRSFSAECGRFVRENSRQSQAKLRHLPHLFLPAVLSRRWFMRISLRPSKRGR